MKTIEVRPIGFVRRQAADENDRDRTLICRIDLDQALAPALDGIEDWSHVYVLCWLDRVSEADRLVLHHPGKSGESQPVGILATRAPIRPNPIGLTLVELVKREKNVLWVRGLDAYDGTPVLDIKPYPDWERGRFLVVTDFRVPQWCATIVEQDG